MWTKRKIVILVAATAALTVGSGVAFAAWTATGTGEGRASATTAVDITVNAVDGAPDLFPGTTEGDLFFTLDNPNLYPVNFTSMTPGPDGIVSSDEENCPADNVSIVGATGLDLTADADDTSAPMSIADVVSLDAAAPDGCQGVSFDISVVLSGTQATP